MNSHGAIHREPNNETLRQARVIAREMTAVLTPWTLCPWCGGGVGIGDVHGSGCRLADLLAVLRPPESAS